jgi:hypothetical protein
MAEKSKFKEEFEKMEYEPVLPIEKKLIIWSIGLGIVLLLIFILIRYTFFPTSP